MKLSTRQQEAYDFLKENGRTDPMALKALGFKQNTLDALYARGRVIVTPHSDENPWPVYGVNPSALELAETVRAKLIEITGGALNPAYMVVLGPEPRMAWDPPRMMSLESYGWSRGLADAELVADEAHDFLEAAVHAVEKDLGVALDDRWDFVTAAVLAFFEAERPY